MENAEKCKDCQTPITYAYREWWDSNDDNACPKGGTHFPFFRTELPPTPAVRTSGPIVKYRKNSTTKRAIPVYGVKAKPRRLITD